MSRRPGVLAPDITATQRVATTPLGYETALMIRYLRSNALTPLAIGDFRPAMPWLQLRARDNAKPSKFLRTETEVASSQGQQKTSRKCPCVRERFVATLPPFIFSGVLLGLLPMWNSAVFIAAAAILGLLFILCPLRRQMLVLAVISGVIALPQMLYLSTGSGRAHMPKLLHWGYTIDHPTVANVANTLGSPLGSSGC